VPEANIRIANWRDLGDDVIPQPFTQQATDAIDVQADSRAREGSMSSLVACSQQPNPGCLGCLDPVFPPYQ
jgi:hypothetical protein